MTLREWLHGNLITGTFLAEKFGVTLSFISRIMTGKNKVPKKMLQEIHEFTRFELTQFHDRPNYGRPSLREQALLQVFKDQKMLFQRGANEQSIQR